MFLYSAELINRCRNLKLFVLFVQFQLSYPELYCSRSAELSGKLTQLGVVGTKARSVVAKQPALLKRSLTKLRNLRL